LRNIGLQEKMAELHGNRTHPTKNKQQNIIKLEKIGVLGLKYFDIEISSATE